MRIYLQGLKIIKDEQLEQGKKYYWYMFLMTRKNWIEVSDMLLLITVETKTQCKQKWVD